MLGTLVPEKALASDSLGPLMEIWLALAEAPDELKRWYAKHWTSYMSGNHIEAYEDIKSSFNNSPNGADLLFLSRACYGASCVSEKMTDT